MTMLRTLFLSIHVAGGGVGLLLGAFAMRPPDTTKSRLPIRLAYAAAVVILVVFLYATLAVDWASLAITQRVAFSVLASLAAFILIRLYLAFRESRQRPANWQTSYINHIYFTYISLWEGFFIVGLIDLGAPGWPGGVGRRRRAGGGRLSVQPLQAQGPEPIPVRPRSAA